MTETWPAGDPRLERHYRRLLWAYPRRFRRGHGDEIVTTLLEMAGPGRRRPAAGDAWHLVASGVRQRFRLPAGRPLIRVSAVLVAVILGAFGAAAGAWIAGATLTPMPTNTAVTALAAQVAPGGEDRALDRSDWSWWGSARTATAAVDAPGWTPGPGRDRLAAGGWHVTAVRDMPGGGQRGYAFDATRNGVHMLVVGYISPEVTTVSLNLTPAGNAATAGTATAATLSGGLFALVVSWPLTAAAAYRTRRLPARRRRIATTLYGLASATLMLPATAASIVAARTLQPSGGIVDAVHNAVNASPYWSYASPGILLPLSVAGLALGVTAWATAGLRPPPEEVTPRLHTAN